MAKIVYHPSAGKDELHVFSQVGGSIGPHFTIWGKGICLHIYEDGLPVSVHEILLMAKALEKELH